jgi:flagellar basal-body rod modification protein FlgD
MNTTAVDSTSQQSTALGATGQLGRDEFLALLVAKLQNQDPLNPAKDTEFVAQLATFSNLEQLIEVNDNLQALGLGQAQLLNAQALSLIGKEALVPGDTVRIASGTVEPVYYDLGPDGAAASLEIRDATGTVVRTIALPPTPSGRQQVAWDGTGADGEMLPDGEYSLVVRPAEGAATTLDVPLYRTLAIDGVSFADGMVTLLSAGRVLPLDSIIEIRDGR